MIAIRRSTIVPRMGHNWTMSTKTSRSRVLVYKRIYSNGWGHRYQAALSATPASIYWRRRFYDVYLPEGWSGRNSLRYRSLGDHRMNNPSHRVKRLPYWGESPLQKVDDRDESPNEKPEGPPYKWLFTLSSLHLFWRLWLSIKPAQWSLKRFFLNVKIISSDFFSIARTLTGCKGVHAKKSRNVVEIFFPVRNFLRFSESDWRLTLELK